MYSRVNTSETLPQAFLHLIHLPLNPPYPHSEMGLSFAVFCSILRTEYASIECCVPRNVHTVQTVTAGHKSRVCMYVCI